MRVPVGVRVGVFALIVMGGYTYFANSIPQIESKPPQELSLEGGNVTPAQLVKAGEEIFHTKGTCEICHRIGQPGTRAPDLAGVGGRAAKRKPGMSAKAYLIESLLQPQAYIVEGYPPIMPAVDKAPIALNRSEVWALTAFLESLGGTVDVTLNDIPASVGAGGGAAAAAEFKIPGDPKGGEAVFQGKGTCIACHKAGKIGASPVGPDLSQIAKIQTPDYIMKKILDPKGSGTVAGFPPGRTPARPRRRPPGLPLPVPPPPRLGACADTERAAKPQAPPERRAVHPAPPASIQFRGKEFNISGAENPLRKDAAKLKEHAAKGGEIYIRNCMYCHGDNLDGKGHFAPGFNPPPANFQDPRPIAMLQEAYLFWRIHKAGPALPAESAPSR